jgi:hypothetical protein
MPAALVIAAYLAAATPAGQTVISSIDLSGPFHTRSHWTFSATQGAEIKDPFIDGSKLPGPVTFCVSRDGGRNCDSSVTSRFAGTKPDDDYGVPHFVRTARVEHLPGKPSRPVLLLSTATIYSGDGNQGIRTELLLYDRARDRFSIAYDRVTGSNNNQEVRFMTSGPLKGDVISAVPTDDKPYGYWVDVSRLDGGAYRQILRFRSATHYGDGNPLAVIDAEMPNIEKRLGLWRAGQPLPQPAKGCARPHLVKTALWCG